MRKTVFLCTCGLFLVFASAFADLIGAKSLQRVALADSVAAPSMLTPAQAWEKIKSGALVIDVRTDEEFASGHLEGSLHIPYDEIEQRLAEVGSDKHRAIVLYCAGGRRAGKAAATLSKLGFDSVFNGGGYDELAEAQPKKS